MEAQLWRDGGGSQERLSSHQGSGSRDGSRGGCGLQGLQVEAQLWPAAGMAVRRYRGHVNHCNSSFKSWTQEPRINLISMRVAPAGRSLGSAGCSRQFVPSLIVVAPAIDELNSGCKSSRGLEQRQQINLLAYHGHTMELSLYGFTAWVHCHLIAFWPQATPWLLPGNAPDVHSQLAALLTAREPMWRVSLGSGLSRTHIQPFWSYNCLIGDSETDLYPCPDSSKGVSQSRKWELMSLSQIWRTTPFVYCLRPNT